MQNIVTWFAYFDSFENFIVNLFKVNASYGSATVLDYSLKLIFGRSFGLSFESCMFEESAEAIRMTHLCKVPMSHRYL